MVGTEQPNGNNKKSSKEDEEKRETGRVKWKVYKTYLQASKAPILWFFVFFFIVSGGLASIGRVWSFKKLTDGSSAEGASNLSATFNRYDNSRIFLQDPQKGMLYSEVVPHSIHTASVEGHSIWFWIGMSVVFYVLMVVLQVSTLTPYPCIAKMLFGGSVRWLSSMLQHSSLQHFHADHLFAGRPKYHNDSDWASNVSGPIREDDPRHPPSATPLG